MENTFFNTNEIGTEVPEGNSCIYSSDIIKLSIFDVNSQWEICSSIVNDTISQTELIFYLKLLLNDPAERVRQEAYEFIFRFPELFIVN